MGYNNKILVSDGLFSLGRNDTVNTPEKLSNKTTIVHAHKTSIIHPHKKVPSKHGVTSAITHEDEKTTLVLVLVVVPSKYGTLSLMRSTGQDNNMRYI